MGPAAAEIIVVPAARQAAVPLVPAILLIVAVVGSEELQITVAVISWLVVSEYIPVAVNCWDVPLARLGFV
jgi:hypothetical protein